MIYIFNDVPYNNIFSLAKIIYKNYNSFSKLFRQDENLLNFVKEQDKEKYEKLIKISKLYYPDDVFLFKVTYILNPFISLRIRDEEFSSYSDLGKKMLLSSPDISSKYFPLIQYDLISYHMEMTGFNKKDEELFLKVKEIEKDEHKQYVYFYLAYLLSKKTTIIYHSEEYKDIYSLCYYILKEEDDISSLGNILSEASFLKAYKDFSRDGKSISAYLHLCSQLKNSEEKLTIFLKKRDRKD